MEYHGQRPNFVTPGIQLTPGVYVQSVPAGFQYNVPNSAFCPTVYPAVYPAGYPAVYPAVYPAGYSAVYTYEYMAPSTQGFQANLPIVDQTTHTQSTPGTQDNLFDRNATFRGIPVERFLAKLDSYCLNPVDMKRSGYPVESELNPNLVEFHNQAGCAFGQVRSTRLVGNVVWNDKDNVDDNMNVYKHTCSRCRSPFILGNGTTYLQHEACCYHWGKKSNRTWTCCQRNLESQPCSVANCHVWSGIEPGFNGPFDNYVRTKTVEDGSLGVYAVDCEMSYTACGLELTRVTVISYDGRVVYDSFVRPKNPIVDFNTRFSGITAKDLEGSNGPVRSLDEVQSNLLEFINSKTILIGHGLESDLRALRILHSRIIDTAVLFPDERGLPFKPSLRQLVLSNLGIRIQVSSDGHSSVEDARACLELVLRKAAQDCAGANYPAQAHFQAPWTTQNVYQFGRMYTRVNMQEYHGQRTHLPTPGVQFTPGVYEQSVPAGANYQAQPYFQAPCTTQNVYQPAAWSTVYQSEQPSRQGFQANLPIIDQTTHTQGTPGTQDNLFDRNATFRGIPVERFLAKLDSYCLNPVDMKRSGYPVESELNPNLVEFHNQAGCAFGQVRSTRLVGNVVWNDKDNVDDNMNVYKHTCSRCRSPFILGNGTTYLQHEACCYHWGKKSNRTWTCCQRNLESQPCSVANCHVWSGIEPGFNGPFDNYVRTKTVEDGSLGVYAVDCEMSYTACGLELTCVTVISYDGRVVYDSFVRPKNPIVDFNTRFSGITAKDLEGSNGPVRSLDEVQSNLLEFINSKTILIGHGLESDLRALRILHSRIIDTAVLFPDERRLPFKPSLRQLVLSNLGIRILASSDGHSSVEDARACLELVLRKVAQDCTA